MSLSREQKMAITGAAAAVGAAALYYFMRSGPKQEQQPAQKEEEPTVEEAVNAAVENFFSDPKAEEMQHVMKDEIFQRSTHISNVGYKLAFALLKGGKTFHGQVEITFTLTADGAKSLPSLQGSDPMVKSDDIFTDYRGDKVHGLVVNGTKVTSGEPFRNHRVYFQQDLLKEGENTVQIRFESKYVRDCQGMHVFKDKDDGEEYIFSQYEAADAHKAFPCFDQPNLKAKYTLLAVVPKGWIVRSTTTEQDPVNVGEKDFSGKLSKFGVDEADFTGLYNGEAVTAFEFPESALISVYLYSLVAGPYQEILSDKPEYQTFKYPMRLYSRKSIASWVEKHKERYFHVTKCGIEYYEEAFSTLYPFKKIDQVFVPDYNFGAMENVGCIVYREDYVERDEKFDEIRWQGIMCTFLHELSHMWFGNLVTMNWWDDLWLNESFANYVSYMALDEAKGLEEYTSGWSIFLDESFWGLGEDQKDTTHPISLDVIHSEAAQDIFDGISYGKGAAWLNQTFFFFGREVFKIGLASYFKEFSFKNSKLEDFIRHMGEAAKGLGIKEDLPKWADTWLKTAGCNIIWHDVVEEGGKIKKFTVNQKVNSEGDSNRLRAQKYQVAFYDENMKVTKVHDITTKDDTEAFDVKELEGEAAPFAYHINYKNYGFAKFKIDAKSLKAFEQKLAKIEDSMSRKQIYNILFDMLKQNDISGAQLLDICKSQMITETAEDVIKDVLRWVIPAVIKTYIPLELYNESHHSIFEMLIDGILASGAIKTKSTQLLVFDSALTSARNEDHYKLLVDWFEKGEVTTTKGKKIEGFELMLKQKHSLVKRIWSSKEVPLAKKESVLAELEKVDKSDWMQHTKMNCRGANPATKDEMWKLFFSTDKDSEIQTWGLHDFQHTFMGFNQVNHYDLIKKFELEFIEKIEEVVAKKGRYQTEAYFYILRQLNRYDDEFIGAWKALLKKVEEKDKNNTFFINFLKDTIFDLNVKKLGCEASKAYLAANKK